MSEQLTRTVLVYVYNVQFLFRITKVIVILVIVIIWSFSGAIAFLPAINATTFSINENRYSKNSLKGHWTCDLDRKPIKFSPFNKLLPILFPSRLEIYRVLSCRKIIADFSNNMSACDFLSLLGASQMWSIW